MVMDVSIFATTAPLLILRLLTCDRETEARFLEKGAFRGGEQRMEMECMEHFRIHFTSPLRE
jgi:hypothetical protein